MPFVADMPGVEKHFDGGEPRSSSHPRADVAAEVASRTDSLLAILSATGIAAHLVLRYAFGIPPTWNLIPLFVTLMVAGVPLLIRLARKVLAREFGSDLLAGISIVAAVSMQQYLVGAIVVLMLAGGTALEELASRRAASVLHALANRMPRIAHRKVENELLEIDIQSISVGDTLVVFPHEICPVDGVVMQGQGKMNEAYLTGEPFEMSKTPGSEVISGAVNGESALTICATRLPTDSRYAKIMQVMQETQQRRPQLRRLGDMLGAWYTPLAVAIAVAAWIASGEPHRFLAVLVIATPCPLLLAIPVAVIGAISLSARRGIIIKNPAILEQISRCTTMILDKTGTLTYGRPAITEIICAPGIAEMEILRLTASLERYSKHPLAGAIVESAERAHLSLEAVLHVNEKQGEGLQGTVDGQAVWVTGRGKVADRNLPLPPVAAGLECLVFLNNEYAATIRFRDLPRAEGRTFVNHLGPRHRINRVLLVSGDRDSEVRYLANLVGIGEVYSAKSPEEKVAIVRTETKSSRTLFVGDGINDAPAMQAATVGVAFGMNSDITAEASDAVILEASLGKVDELMHIGHRMRTIALTSAVGGMALSLIGMVAAATGHLLPIEGAIAQEAIDLAAVLNAVRAALPFRRMTDF